MALTRPVSPLTPGSFRGFAIDVAARRLARDWNRRLRPYGLSYIPYFVLLLGGGDEGARPSDVAAALDLDGSSLTGHLDRLEAAGLIERRPEPGDRRVSRIALTERGRHLIEELEPLGRVMSALEPGALAPPRLENRTAVPRPRGGAVVTLRATTLTVADSAVGAVLTRFAALVAERSGGALRVELELPSRAPGGELQALVDVRSGELALASITTPVAGTLLTDAQLVELPYLLDSAAHARAFIDGPFGTQLLASAERFGLVGLALIGNGFRSLTTRDRALRDPEDAAGLRLRVQQSPINVHLAEALGAIAVPIPFPRLAEALAAGEIDAQENALCNAAGLELWRWQRALTLTRHTFSAHLVLANAEILGALGSGAAVVHTAMRDALAADAESAEQREDLLVAGLSARMNVVTLHADERMRFVDATRLVRERMARALGDDAVSRVLAAAAAARISLALI